MIGFLGEYEVKLDARGRFLFPSGFKKQLEEGGTAEEETFVLNRGFEKCLTLYPLSTWKPIYERMIQLNSFEPKVRAFKRIFLNGANYVKLDSAGRLLIPKNLSAYAGLKKEIVLTSDFNKIEIWDKVQYEQFFESYSSEEFSELAQQVMGNNEEDKG